MEHGGPYVSKIENRNRHVEIVALARALDHDAGGPDDDADGRQLRRVRT